MQSNEIVQVAVAAEAKVEVSAPEYRRPEVHDLGKLELVQGGLGFSDDCKGLKYIARPIG